MNFSPRLRDFTATPGNPSQSRPGLVRSDGRAWLDAGVLDPTLRGILLPAEEWVR